MYPNAAGENDPFPRGVILFHFFPLIGRRDVPIAEAIARRSLQSVEGENVNLTPLTSFRFSNKGFSPEPQKQPLTESNGFPPFEKPRQPWTAFPNHPRPRLPLSLFNRAFL
jgi:hypothetical protein